MGSQLRKLRQRKAAAEAPSIVYGAGCLWWDSIDKAGRQSPSGLPCCPHCQGLLLQITASDWDRGVADHGARDPEYAAIVAWVRGQCFKSFAAARAAYAEAHPA